MLAPQENGADSLAEIKETNTEEGLVDALQLLPVKAKLVLGRAAKWEPPQPLNEAQLSAKKVPELKERIEGTKNRLKKKEFLNVLKYLVEKSQIDHIWSSACDAPPNCIHEWGPVNNHFKDFKYQQAKLRRYGATVARVSAKWMDECIVAEGKCLSLA